MSDNIFKLNSELHTIIQKSEMIVFMSELTKQIGFDAAEELILQSILSHKMKNLLIESTDLKKRMRSIDCLRKGD